MRFNQIESYEPKSFANFVEAANDAGHSSGVQVSGTGPDDLEFSIVTDAFGDCPPTITYRTELDSDGEEQFMYFLPILEIPTLDTYEMDASIGYYFRQCESLGKFVKWLFDHPYSVPRYTEGLYYKEGDNGRQYFYEYEE